MSEVGKRAGHVFLSYVREDSSRVDELQRVFEGAGISVWRDTDSLWPGQDWRANIRQAITSNALIFIACFSKLSVNQKENYQNEELILAIEQLRRRPPGDPWIIPVRFDECDIPDFDLGVGRTLQSIQHADLFGDEIFENTSRLVTVIVRILDGERSSVAARRPGGGSSEDFISYSKGVQRTTIFASLRRHIVLASIAIATMILVFGLVLYASLRNNLYSMISSKPSAHGAAVLVNVIHEGEQIRPVNGAFAFTEALRLTKNDLKYIDRQGITAWAVPRGGYDIGSTRVKVTLTAKQSVRIVGMRAIILSMHAPANGTFFGIVSQGFVPNTALDISLASSSPVALVVGRTGFATKEPYFQKYSYDLRPSQAATFEITAYSAPSYNSTQQGEAVTWVLRVSILVHSRLEYMTVKDSDGKPFATTGLATKDRNFENAYGAVYTQCLYADFKVAPCKNVKGWVRLK